MGVILISSSVSGVVGTLFMRRDIWWTPVTMKVALDDSRDRVEVFVKEIPLGDLLTEGALVIRAGAEERILNKADVNFRFNNYDNVKASKIPIVASSSAIIMAGLISLIYGLIGLYTKKKIKPDVNLPAK